MSSPTISIIIAIHNAAPFLRQCLNSLIWQTYEDWEAICINDGSTDDSLQLLQQYAQQDARFQIYTQANQGAGVARNKGLSLASGKYIQFLDADDFFDFYMLERLLKKAQQTDADIVLAASWSYEMRSGKLSYNTFCQDHRFLPTKEVFNRQDLPLRLFQFCIAWAWDKFYKASFIKKYNFQFQNLKANNDMVFAFISIACAQKISFSPDAYIYWRKGNPYSITASQAKTPLCFYDAMLALKKQLINHHIWEDLEHSYNTYVLQWSLQHFQKIASKEVYNALHNYIYKNLGVSRYPVQYYTYDPLHAILMHEIISSSYRMVRLSCKLKYFFYRFLSICCFFCKRNFFHKKAKLFKQADLWFEGANLPGIFGH